MSRSSAGWPRSVGSVHDREVQVSEIQRSRPLAAAVVKVDEFGYDGASVAQITARARVSRRTFYELFDNREECLIALLDSAVEQIAMEIAMANLEGLSWRERVRGGLLVILSFFDREPALARVCVNEIQRAGRPVLERRWEILDRLAVIVDEGRGEGARVSAPSGLTAQGVVGAVSQILHARLLRPGREPLQSMLGDLMAMIVLPYMGSQVAGREQARRAPVPLPAVADELSLTPTPVSFEQLARIPMRLTYRTALVLQDVAEHPKSSNRQVADRVGIHDQGQASKLLVRLERLGLLSNAAGNAPAKGEANEWRLTPTGKEVVSAIRGRMSHTRRRRAA